jgi:hypothetical protein
VAVTTFGRGLTVILNGLGTLTPSESVAVAVKLKAVAAITVGAVPLSAPFEFRDSQPGRLVGENATAPVPPAADSIAVYCAVDVVAGKVPEVIERPGAIVTDTAPCAVAPAASVKIAVKFTVAGGVAVGTPVSKPLPFRLNPLPPSPVALHMKGGVPPLPLTVCE